MSKTTRRMIVTVLVMPFLLQFALRSPTVTHQTATLQRRSFGPLERVTRTPTPADTRLPDLTLPPTYTPTATPHSTQTPISQLTTPTPGEFVIGRSANDLPIEGWVYPARVEENSRALVLVNAIHGDENNVGPVLDQFRADLEAEGLVLPADLALYIVFALNPDGMAANQRFNGNGIDLNRNWDTYDWSADTETVGGLILGGGGLQPFSEPETSAMRDWLLARQLAHPGGVMVVYFHAAFPPDGLVTPGTRWAAGRELADMHSRQAGEVFAAGAGYPYTNHWEGGYQVTGDASTWAVAQDMLAITVELPGREPLDDAQAARLRVGIQVLASWLSR